MLSGGEQQRVTIARALINEPAILLADEPTGNLDPDLSLEIMNLLLDLQQKGTTVMVATHDRVLLERYRRRTVLLNRGYLIEDGLQSGGSMLDDDDEEVSPS
jgi:cell division transport system ATP-binding protein